MSKSKSYTRGQQQMDIEMLHEPEILNSLQQAREIYDSELEAKGYSPLTRNSYNSAVNRFIDFLEIGEVIPDPDNSNFQR